MLALDAREAGEHDVVGESAGWLRRQPFWKRDRRPPLAGPTDVDPASPQPSLLPQALGLAGVRSWTLVLDSTFTNYASIRGSTSLKSDMSTPSRPLPPFSPASPYARPPPTSPHRRAPLLAILKTNVLALFFLVLLRLSPFYYSYRALAFRTLGLSRDVVNGFETVVITLLVWNAFSAARKLRASGGIAAGATLPASSASRSMRSTPMSNKGSPKVRTVCSVASRDAANAEFAAGLDHCLSDPSCTGLAVTSLTRLVRLVDVDALSSFEHLDAALQSSCRRIAAVDADNRRWPDAQAVTQLAAARSFPARRVEVFVLPRLPARAVRWCCQ